MEPETLVHNGRKLVDFLWEAICQRRKIKVQASQRRGRLEGKENSKGKSMPKDSIREGELHEVSELPAGSKTKRVRNRPKKEGSSGEKG